MLSLGLCILLVTLLSADAQSAQWGIDTTISLSRTEFLKIGSLVATKDAYDMTTTLNRYLAQNETSSSVDGRGPSLMPYYYDTGSDSGSDWNWTYDASTTVTLPQGFGSTQQHMVEVDGVSRAILKDKWIGAAHAYCQSLEVTEEPDRAFRMCTQFEVSAIAAVVPLPRGRVAAYASSDGDDIDVGTVFMRTEIEDADGTGAELYMQQWEGVDDEVSLWSSTTDTYQMFAYCCSSPFSLVLSEGSSRRRS